MSVAIDVALGVCEAGAVSPRFGGVRRAAYAQAAGSLRLVKAIEDADDGRLWPKGNGVAVHTSDAA